MNTKKLIAFTGACIWAGSLAHASQTVSYTYDVLGRLVVVQTQGSAGSSVTQNFSYDAAGNRSKYQTLLNVTLSMNSPTVNLTSAGATLTVYISNPSASGTVTYTEANGTVLGQASLSDGQATVIVEGLSKGTYAITASYSGDGADAPQTATFTVNVENLNWLPAVLQLLLQ